MQDDLPITEMLRTQSLGVDELIRLAYDELKRVASHERRRVFSGRPVTKQTTEVVHEAWEKLHRAIEQSKDGDQFFGIARIIIRHLLVDYARQRTALKRGAGLRGVALDEAFISTESKSDRLPLEYAELLDRFALVDARASEVFALCMLGGFSQSEAASDLGISLATVERDLKFARAWWAKEVTIDVGKSGLHKT